eukprot:TRINITY_DN8358_c0_g1_i4.p1 TRINITY_DN8358_c0_g1~~TRINITY_DN8358_c0_g1_i4.p1  ORF type:complete len:172 (-),score=61.36 TRINITY_DN8358_c0_g1_i4:295-810(-)
MQVVYRPSRTIPIPVAIGILGRGASMRVLAQVYGVPDATSSWDCGAGVAVTVNSVVQIPLNCTVTAAQTGNGTVFSLFSYFISGARVNQVPLVALPNVANTWGNSLLSLKVVSPSSITINGQLQYYASQFMVQLVSYVSGPLQIVDGVGNGITVQSMDVPDTVDIGCMSAW